MKKRLTFPCILAILVCVAQGCNQAKDGVAPAGGGATGPAPKDKADISIAADDLWKEYNANKEAAKTKFEGKTIEVTGPAKNIETNISGDAYIKMGGGAFPPFFSAFTAEKDPWAKVAIGQEVTLRGVADLSFGVNLMNSVIVKTGPTTANITTAEAMLAEFKKDAAAFKTKYVDKSTIVDGEVVEKTANEAGATEFFLKAGDGKISCSMTAFPDDKKAAAGVKVGQHVKFYGVVQDFSTEPELKFCKVITK